MRGNPALFPVLLLVPLATLHAGLTLTEVPRFGKLRAGSFQSMETAVR